MPQAVAWLAALRGTKLGLRSHLVLFGLAIVVPVLLYIGFLLHRYTQQEHLANEQRALEIARALNADIDREIIAIITTLETLATDNALATGDFEAFHARARQALQPRRWNVVLIDTNNQQLVNTRVPWGTPLPVSSLTDPDLPKLARQTGEPYVTDLFLGTVAQRLIFSVSVPVRVGQEVRYALVMSLEPERLVEILGGDGLPAGWLAMIADRKNRIMARSQLAKEFLGKPVPPRCFGNTRERREGVITTEDDTGEPALHAFHTSKLTQLARRGIGAAALVEGSLWQAWTWFLWSGAALLSLSVLMAVAVGRLMAAPIAELARAGEALGQAKPVAPISSTLREVDELSLVLVAPRASSMPAWVRRHTWPRSSRPPPAPSSASLPTASSAPGTRPPPPCSATRPTKPSAGPCRSCRRRMPASCSTASMPRCAPAPPCTSTSCAATRTAA